MPTPSFNRMAQLFKEIYGATIEETLVESTKLMPPVPLGWKPTHTYKMIDFPGITVGDFKAWLVECGIPDNAVIHPGIYAESDISVEVATPIEDEGEV